MRTIGVIVLAVAIVARPAIGQNSPVPSRPPPEPSSRPAAFGVPVDRPGSPTVPADTVDRAARRTLLAPPDAGVLRRIVGFEPQRRRVIAGLWALHPFEPQFPEVEWTHGFGAQLSHWVAATFINSYGERAFIAGVERYWARKWWGDHGVGVGYRVGLVSGYDERLFELAGHTPLLPFGGLLVWSQVGPVGVDVYYVYRAITLEASIGF